MNIFSRKIKRNKGLPAQAGMSYVEVIVVLSIFSVVSSVAMFNYRDFQDRVDMKNLASDVALKIVEAQKSALSGFTVVGASSSWKPSYGVYFDINPVSEKTSFAYFSDLNNSGGFDGSKCTGECLSNISITKGNLIDSLLVHNQDGTDTVIQELAVSFSRLGSGATITSGVTEYPTSEYAQITVRSPKGATAFIKVHRSGRIEID